MALIRSLVFSLAFFLNNLLWFVAGMPFMVLHWRPFWRYIGHPWARSNLWWHRVICGNTIELRGLENLPATGCIIASKHQSAWETLALASLVPGPAFILKRELTWIPFFGWYLIASGQIAIDRSKRGAAVGGMIERSRAAVAEGKHLMIFPEGTRRAIGAEPAYRFGVAHLYEALGVVCVPVAVNSGLFWPRRSLIKRPGRIVLEFLPPIQPGMPKEAFFETVKERIETATDRLVADGRRTMAEAEGR